MFATPWISRLAAVFLLIVAIVAGYSLVLEPIFTGYGETGRKIDEAREQLSHYQRLAAARPILEKQMLQAATQQTSQGYYLSGSTDALAAAGLQDRVNALIQDNGGSLHSIQPMPGSDEQGFRRITLRVLMSAPVETLFETLYALEAGTPILFVENLDIQSRLVRRRSNQASLQAVSDAPLLRVGFDLSGYMPIDSQ